MGSRVFFGGLPTEVDVRNLREAFGVPTEGTRIPYESVSAVIKVPVMASRFRTVTCVWRRGLEREHNIILRAGDGHFTAANPAERIDLGSAKLRSGARAFRRAHTVVETTDRARLSEEQRKQADHVIMLTATAMQAARIAARKPVPVLETRKSSEHGGSRPGLVG